MVIDLSEVTHIKRHVVGNSNPKVRLGEEEIQQQVEQLNEYLEKGRIVNIEKYYTVVQSGDAQLVMEYCAYHLGFKRKIR